MAGLFASTELVYLTPDQRFGIKLKKERTEELKNFLPVARRAPNKTDWVVPAQEQTAAQLHRMRLPFSKAAWELAELLPGQAQRLIEASRCQSADLELEGFGKEPRPFQKAGVLYMVERERVILGDGMGLGKTIQGLAAALVAKSFPLLVVTPSSNKENWAFDEIPKCLPGKVVVLADKSTPLPRLLMADVIVTNYEQLVGYRKIGDKGRTCFEDPGKKIVILSDLANNLMKVKLKGVILDEAHYIKSADAARSMAVMKLKSARYRWCLTGTPVLSKPGELWSLFKFLDRTDEMGGFWHFFRRYCGMKKGRFGMEAKEALNTKELNDLMRATCYIRREKKEVLTELPDKTRTSFLSEISNRAEYIKAEKELVEWVKERVRKDEEFLESIKHLQGEAREMAIRERQEAKAAAAERNETIVRISALKRVVAEGKLHGAKEWIDNFLESGEKLVVFAISKKIIAQLLAWYPNAARIISEDSSTERQRNVKRFQEDEKCQLFVGAMGTSAAASPAGIGHTLTSASSVLFLELGWTEAHMSQCEDRIHRIGQKNAANIYYFLGRNTIDEWLCGIIEDKRTMGAQVLDGHEEAQEAGILNQVRDWLAKK